MSRWPIIRHVRWYYHAQRFQFWWWHTGRYLGAVPSSYDTEFLDNVWSGKA